METTNNKTLFADTYKQSLSQLWQDPEYDYVRSIKDNTPEKLADKMIDSILSKRASIDSKGFKLTCKKLGIKHTYKSIYEFLGI